MGSRRHSQQSKESCEWSHFMCQVGPSSFPQEIEELHLMLELRSIIRVTPPIRDHGAR